MYSIKDLEVEIKRVRASIAANLIEAGISKEIVSRSTKLDNENLNKIKQYLVGRY